MKEKILSYKEAAIFFKMSYSTFKTKTARAEFNKFRTRDFMTCERKNLKFKRLIDCIIVNDDFIDLLNKIRGK